MRINKFSDLEPFPPLPEPGNKQRPWIGPDEPAECRVPGCSDRSQPKVPYCFDHNRKWNTYKRRGFNQEQFESLICQTVCACCGKEYHILWLDHDHTHHPENKACPICSRGMVCPRCNNWLGGLDEPGWLEKAQFYLSQYAKGERTYRLID